ncbi:MAG: UDP-N-acetylmuramate dehydrogenase [Oscillospiraceae bacterium]|nr:UDP-N-acetylmuramate dehydrogenase [Oscillospiraceae bacterium]
MSYINAMSIITRYCGKTGCTVKTNESLKDYTTFKIGGTANLVVFPDNIENFTGLFKIIKEYDLKYILLGNGSNVLLCENNFDGVVIITSRMNNIRLGSPDFSDSEKIYADCGASLNRLANTARDNSLSGLEFAYGIPGTLGGAVCMNAGAYGGQISDVIYSSEYIDCRTCEVFALDRDAHEFAYRESVYEKNKDYILLSAALELKRGEKSAEEIEAAMNKNMAARKEKQPLEYPSAGSVFKRGADFFTARLIDESGLKGCRIGGAQVSEKHAGFIINRGGAKFSDVLKLIERIKSDVYSKTGKKIECEIKIIEF